ncbi:MAG: tyrosine--tRNA ligase [Bacteroidetes bacterium]|nr:tyrosine--tRNA ligase [Bacteroidota bacterium]
MDLVKELQWRGMIHDIIPGTEEQLKKEMTTGYIGFDPTADSLHIGNLVPIMLLVFLQRAGHKPIVLVGGATGMVGDPSGKSEERNLLDDEVINHNLESQKKQLMKFLDFGDIKNKAEMVNNYDWFKEMGFLQFIRDVGKHITVNYMMAKDSVQNRLEGGLSFTEFSYQLVQGYDFYHLYKTMDCKLQMGGSDQWGNMVTGTELIRRMDGGEAFALTAPLIRKADGSKFGKTEDGNVWLDPEKTSPYKFYQFWLNCSDDEAASYIRIFTLLDEPTIKHLEKEHKENPHLRALQKALAKEVTKTVHSEDAYNSVVKASEILFGKSTKEMLGSIPFSDILAVLDISRNELTNGLNIVDFVSATTQIFSSKGEARRTLEGGGLSINKEKVESIDVMINSEDLLNDKYILVQKGKKNYFLVTVN